jgi:hypothetical protein
MLFVVAMLVALLGVAAPFLVIFNPRLGAGILYHLRTLRIATLEFSLLLGIIAAATQPGPTAFDWLLAILLLGGLGQGLYPQRFLVAIDAPEHKNPADEAPQAGRKSEAPRTVFGVVLSGEAGAYPLSILAAHTIINDRLAGKAVLASYCPVCRSGLIYAAHARGKDLTFEVAGFFRRNLVMRDRQTGSLWQQATGEAVYGPLKGARLTLLPGTQALWEDWWSEHPETWLAMEPRGRHGLLPLKALNRLFEAATNLPRLMPGKTDLEDSLPAREWVAGLAAGGEARAYALPRLAGYAALEDALGGTPLVIRYDPGIDRVWVFDRRIAGETQSLAWVGGGWLAEPSGQRWDAEGNPSKTGGEILQPMTVQRSWWLGWKEFHPNTSVFNRLAGEKRG